MLFTKNKNKSVYQKLKIAKRTEFCAVVITKKRIFYQNAKIAKRAEFCAVVREKTPSFMKQK